MRNLWKLLAILLALAMVAAACGDDDDTSSGDDGADAPSDDGGDDGTDAPSDDGGDDGSEPTDDGEEPMEEGGTIAFSYGNETAGIYPIVAGPARIQAEDRGYEFLEGAANGDCEQQVQDVENFVTQGVDAIVVLPLCGVEPLQPVLDQAEEAGIPVVGYSTEVPTGDGALVYSNIQGAEELANEALRWLEEDFTGDPENFSWVLFTFDQCGSACTERTDPIRQIIVDATGVEPLEAEVVAEADGLTATETFFQSNPDIAIVIGINDAGALGARQAVLSQISTGRSPSEFFVAGMDGQNEALELIAAGDPDEVYRASAALILDDLGRAVANLPIDIVEGTPPANGVFVLPYDLITVDDAAQAQQILDNYNAFTGG